jgi:SAM-dependent methyltransferase
MLKILRLLIIRPHNEPGGIVLTIAAEAFDPSLEVGVYSFSSFEDWKTWRPSNDWFGVRSGPKEIVDYCLLQGIASGWFGHIPPEKVSCATENYRESLIGNGFNPRQRVMLETLAVLTKGREMTVRIYAAEGITPFAREVRERYPHFTGSEYGPSSESKARFAPVEHQDLAALTYPDESFDICITNEVFEHLPDLDAAIGELHRVLAPGGILISTFPFLQNRQESVIKAFMSEPGNIEYLMEPEYHGNPVDPTGGSLVFQLPGWEILDKCRHAGFLRSSMNLIVSLKSGITSRDYCGVFVLSATR